MRSRRGKTSSLHYMYFKKQYVKNIFIFCFLPKKKLPVKPQHLIQYYDRHLPNPRGLVHRRGCKHRTVSSAKTHTGHSWGVTFQWLHHFDGTLMRTCILLPQSQLPDFHQVVVTARQRTVHLTLICNGQRDIYLKWFLNMTYRH